MDELMSEAPATEARGLYYVDATDHAGGVTMYTDDNAEKFGRPSWVQADGTKVWETPTWWVMTFGGGKTPDGNRIPRRAYVVAKAGAAGTPTVTQDEWHEPALDERGSPLAVKASRGECSVCGRWAWCSPTVCGRCTRSPFAVSVNLSADRQHQVRKALRVLGRLEGGPGGDALRSESLYNEVTEVGQVCSATLFVHARKVSLSLRETAQTAAGNIYRRKAGRFTVRFCKNGKTELWVTQGFGTERHSQRSTPGIFAAGLSEALRTLPASVAARFEAEVLALGRSLGRTYDARLGLRENWAVEDCPTLAALWAEGLRPCTTEHKNYRLLRSAWAETSSDLDDLDDPYADVVPATEAGADTPAERLFKALGVPLTKATRRLALRCLGESGGLVKLAVAGSFAPLLDVDGVQSLLREEGVRDQWVTAHVVASFRSLLGTQPCPWAESLPRETVMRIAREFLRNVGDSQSLWVDTARSVNRLWAAHRDLIPGRVRSLREFHDAVTLECLKVENAPIPYTYPAPVAALDGEMCGPWTLRLPESSTALVVWGAALKHCVGTYGRAMASGRCLILGVEEGGAVKYTIEVSPRGDVRQFYGACNQRPDGRTVSGVTDWLAELGLVNAPLDWLASVGGGEGADVPAQDDPDDDVFADW